MSEVICFSKFFIWVCLPSSHTSPFYVVQKENDSIYSSCSRCLTEKETIITAYTRLSTRWPKIYFLLLILFQRVSLMRRISFVRLENSKVLHLKLICFLIVCGRVGDQEKLCVSIESLLVHQVLREVCNFADLCLMLMAAAYR
jgi:hypothetical protein